MKPKQVSLVISDDEWTQFKEISRKKLMSARGYLAQLVKWEIEDANVK